MMTEDNTTELFSIRITENGKKYISRFASISYVIIALVLVDTVINLITFWGILIEQEKGIPLTIYNKIYPYMFLVFLILGLISNFYYTRFPRQLIKSIRIGDEYGANKAFGGLVKGAYLFLVYLILLVLTNIMNFIPGVATNL